MVFAHLDAHPVMVHLDVEWSIVVVYDDGMSSFSSLVMILQPLDKLEVNLMNYDGSWLCWVSWNLYSFGNYW